MRHSFQKLNSSFSKGKRGRKQTIFLHLNNIYQAYKPDLDLIREKCASLHQSNVMKVRITSGDSSWVFKQPLRHKWDMCFLSLKCKRLCRSAPYASGNVPRHLQGREIWRKGPEVCCIEIWHSTVAKLVIRGWAFQLMLCDCAKCTTHTCTLPADSSKTPNRNDLSFMSAAFCDCFHRRVWYPLKASFPK